jgi:hypothetical protein
VVSKKELGFPKKQILCSSHLAAALMLFLMLTEKVFLSLAKFFTKNKAVGF